MEDKRTLLAFLIIGLILLGMPYYFELLGVSKTSPARQTQTPTSEPAPARSADQPAIQVPPTEAILLAQPAPASQAVDFVPRQVVVHTPLQRLVLSTAGGTLVSAQLQLYHKQPGEPVELVPAGGKGLVLALKNGDSVLDLSAVAFAPDKEDLRLGPGEEASLRMQADLGEGRLVEKVLRFHGDRYGIGLTVRLSGFQEDTEALLTWYKGIGVAEKRPEIDLSEMRALAYMNGELTEFRIKEKEEEPLEDKGPLRWVGVRNKYFVSAMAFQEEEQLRFKLSGRPAEPGAPEYSHQVGLRIGPAGTWTSTVYLGPMDYEKLAYYQVDLERAMSLGWPVVREVSKLLIIVFMALHEYVPNYGWVIVVFSLVVKVLVYPLTHKSYESAAKMQEVQPKISALREKYKKDNQRLSKETMKLYKEAGVNPLGGCLPMLLQMPIFFALYQVFSSTIELRQAPFILWISDLSLPDEVMIGGFGLHVLPLLMALSMMVQQKMTMKDPRQAALVYLMPAFMVFIFWKLSSGLVLYWTVFNVLTIAQQWLIEYLKRRQAPPAPLVVRR